MTKDWDFYFCNVDDQLASIYADLGAVELLPIETHPVIAYLRLGMINPRQDGLSSSEEYDALVAIEDALETLCVGGKIMYVGRCTSNGRRDFYFYVEPGVDWHDCADKCMGAFPEYQYEIGSRPDAAWSTYHTHLFRSEVKRQSIENRRVCAVLERHGDELRFAREIDHWAQFSNAGDRASYVTGAVRLGFAVRGLTICEGDEAFSAQLFRADIPTPSGIDDITLPLYRLALECNGSYDGWECVVVCSDPSAEILDCRSEN